MLVASGPFLQPQLLFLFISSCISDVCYDIRKLTKCFSGDKNIYLSQEEVGDTFLDSS